jgi:hypothetical protein
VDVYRDAVVAAAEPVDDAALLTDADEQALTAAMHAATAD